MKKYLIDTNILIYYFADTIPLKEVAMVGYEKAKEFLGYAKTIQLNNKIAELSIELRRNGKVKLPDAVIAATALCSDLILVTRNSKDFKEIEILEIYNPFQTK